MKRFLLLTIFILYLCIPLSFTMAQESTEGRPQRSQRIQQFLKQMDTDGDGKISKEEYMTFHTERAQKRFERVDVNSDGFVTAEELKEARAAAREKSAD